MHQQLSQRVSPHQILFTPSGQTRVVVWYWSIVPVSLGIKQIPLDLYTTFKHSAFVLSTLCFKRHSL